jgi:hypothetical protein
MLDVLGIKDAQKLVPMDEDQKPTDPVSENQNVLTGKTSQSVLVPRSSSPYRGAHVRDARP